MAAIDDLPEAAIGLRPFWGPRPAAPSRSRTTGPGGETLTVIGHRASRALVVDRTIEARRMGRELAWRVAYDGIALRIRVRRSLAGWLRPVEPKDTACLLDEELLRSDRLDFPARRDEAIDRLLMGSRRRALIRHGDLLLAALAPDPPAMGHPLADAAEDELSVLRRLRSSPIGREELVRLLDIWDAQLERRGAPTVPELPVVRVISGEEDELLRRLRSSSAETRRTLAGLLRGPLAAPRASASLRTRTPNPPDDENNL